MSTLLRHPVSWQARLVRAGRALRAVRGWRRLANQMLPTELAGEYVVLNDGVLFAGELDTWIERETYLYGQYEAEPLRLFLATVPSNRRRTLLDVGANVGTHSSVFARHFTAVHAFEPNPAVWSRFDRNMSLNAYTNVQLHRIGLADASSSLPFHATETANRGLGTFACVEQYDAPLRQIATLSVTTGDDFLRIKGITEIDAIKIDVQGYETQVLRGLRKTLAEHRPIVWFELGAGTMQLPQWRDLEALFPYSIRVQRYGSRGGLLTHSLRLEPVDAGSTLVQADYLVSPA